MTLIDDVKRLLASPASRIELDDVIRDELARLSAELREPRFARDEQTISEETVQRCLSAYEEASENACAIGALVARWEDASNVQLLCRFFTGLADINDGASGTAVWIAASWIPFLRLMYATGLSAIVANRYSVLASVYAVRRGVRTRNHEPRLAYIQAMSAFAENNGNALLKVLPNYRGKLTPLSEYLVPTLPRSLSVAVGLGDEFGEAFDRYEHLQATSFVLERQWKSPHAVLGRFAWKYKNADDGGTYRELESEAEALGENRLPAQGGLFAASTQVFLDASKRYREEVLNRLPWG
jgi:hypothetical protein